MLAYGEWLVAGDLSPYAQARATFKSAGPEAGAIMAALESAIYRHQWHLVAPLLQEFDDARKRWYRAGYQLKKVRKSTIKIGDIEISYIPGACSWDTGYCFRGQGWYRAMPAKEAKQKIIQLMQG